MRRIESRLRKLESALELRDRPQCRGLAVISRFVPFERKNNLGAGERVVVDWFRNSNSMTYGRERIVCDTADKGRKCKPGGYLLDVIEEIHQGCFHREITGSCQICRNTPAAAGPTHSLISSEQGVGVDHQDE